MARTYPSGYILPTYRHKYELTTRRNISTVDANSWKVGKSVTADVFRVGLLALGLVITGVVVKNTLNKK